MEQTTPTDTSNSSKTKTKPSREYPTTYKYQNPDRFYKQLDTCCIYCVIL